MRLLGMLLTLAIVCILAVYAFRQLGVAPSGDAHDAQWYYAHPTERAAQLQYCNAHPQEQNSGECLQAIAAQTHADAEAAAHQ